MAFTRVLFSFASSSSSSHCWTVFILLSVMSPSMLPAVLCSCFCSPCNYLLNGDERCKCCVYHLMGKRSGDPNALNLGVNEKPVSVRNENVVEFDDNLLPRPVELYPETAASEMLPSSWSKNVEPGFVRKVSNLKPNEVTKTNEIVKSDKSILSDPAFARYFTTVKNLQAKSGRNVKQFAKSTRNKLYSLFWV
ncbi:hypothetical protein CHS0354_015088 [Potamilus streckersoni]|uniref:Uncharacterized protein n=1 Tax=Potamilus streckersoni TaxID=2493646 RepID=A0AAE0TGG3_9BIVA|nr:hypothetical protein CHS0354_015088 [Potamilus streckersoni]